MTLRAVPPNIEDDDGDPFAPGWEAMLTPLPPVAEQRPATVQVPPKRSSDDYTDAVQAERFAADELQGRFVWSAAFGWARYDERRWDIRQTEEGVIEVCRQWTIRRADEKFADLLAQYGGMVMIPDSEWRDLGVLRKLQSGATVRELVRLARGIVQVSAGDFDTLPDVLNANNGTVDLRTGEIRRHDPADLLTKMTPVDYRPEAVSHPDLRAVLSAVSEDVQPWLQIRLGQAATGHPTPDDVAVVAQGIGANAKSTFFGCAQNALGEFAVLISDRVLVAADSAHPTEKMELRGARLALIEEVPGGRELNMNKLKKIVGTPKIEARHIAKDSVTFDATHSLFITTNDQLIVRATDYGSWRRLALLRFPYRFRKPGELLELATDRRGDPDLRHRALHDRRVLEAMLAWIVDGARRWYACGMPSLPERVEADTAAWRRDSDLILGYVEDTLEFDPGAHVLVEDVHQDFCAWLASRGHATWTMRAFRAALLEHSAIPSNVRPGRTRKNEGLSRPPNGLKYGPLVNPAAVLLGVRFRESAAQNDA